MALCPFATWDEINGPSNSYTGGPYRIVHHVTDGSDYPRSTYAERKNEPHFTVTSTRIYQHVDTAKASRALKNPPGGVETNRLSAVQIEVVGYSGKPKNRDTLRNMARLCRWIEATHGIPQLWPNGYPRPPRNGQDPGGHNRDAATWSTQGGHYGHCHVPENDHWDPGYTAEELEVVMGKASPSLKARGAALAEAGAAPAPDAAEAAAALVRAIETRQAAAVDARAQALAEVESAGERPYYDAEADARARDAYYAGLDLSEGRSGAELYAVLSAHLERTHTTRLDYAPGRHLHGWVDVYPDRLLHSIYTGDTYEPREVVEAALAAEADFLGRQVELAMSALSGDPRREAGALALLESGPPYDCEHVVPQSWFRGGHSGVPKGDLHHLFTCKHACNGYRASVPFWEFPDHDPAGADCGWKEPDRFEPAEGRSQAARAVFYFLLRYPGMIDDVPGELQRERLGTLLAWHQLEPPTLYELHRNAAIQEKQGVRNPLVDFPQLASRIDFTQGLGG